MILSLYKLNIESIYKILNFVQQNLVRATLKIKFNVRSFLSYFLLYDSFVIYTSYFNSCLLMYLFISVSILIFNCSILFLFLFFCTTSLSSSYTQKLHEKVYFVPIFTESEIGQWTITRSKKDVNYFNTLILYFKYYLLTLGYYLGYLTFIYSIVVITDFYYSSATEPLLTIIFFILLNIYFLYFFIIKLPLTWKLGNQLYIYKYNVLTELDGLIFYNYKQIMGIYLSFICKLFWINPILFLLFLRVFFTLFFVVCYVSLWSLNFIYNNISFEFYLIEDLFDQTLSFFRIGKCNLIELQYNYLANNWNLLFNNVKEQSNILGDYLSRINSIFDLFKEININNYFITVNNDFYSSLHLSLADLERVVAPSKYDNLQTLKNNSDYFTWTMKGLSPRVIYDWVRPNCWENYVLRARGTFKEITSIDMLTDLRKTKYNYLSDHKACTSVSMQHVLTDDDASVDYYIQKRVLREPEATDRFIKFLNMAYPHLRNWENIKFLNDSRDLSPYEVFSNHLQFIISNYDPKLNHMLLDGYPNMDSFISNTRYSMTDYLCVHVRAIRQIEGYKNDLVEEQLVYLTLTNKTKLWTHWEVVGFSDVPGLARKYHEIEVGDRSFTSSLQSTSLRGTKSQMLNNMFNRDMLLDRKNELRLHLDLWVEKDSTKIVDANIRLVQPDSYNKLVAIMKYDRSRS